MSGTRAGAPSPPTEDHADPALPTRLCPPPGWRAPKPGRCYLGVDTGGTFTDAVLIGDQGEVLATAKRLTTRHDLAAGIDAALAALPAEWLARCSLASLSTTLTTNAVVEGKGAPVCVLLAGYDARQIAASGLADLVGADGIVALAGGHDAMGQELVPLDEASADAAITRLAPQVSAFAISASFAVRNPAHERRLAARVAALSGRPVSCGHELASSLGAPRRALTAALNARMVAFVAQLIESVQRVLAARGIAAPLMVVRGDGSLVNARTALRRPVTTVLSGPAASMIGACALSGHRTALVADMGGTTTDIAVVRDGRPDLAADGALVGPWRPMVEAVKVCAIGLGGDSELRFGGGEGLAIGPRRVIPLALLTHEHPRVLDVLRRQQKESPHAAQARFVQRWHADEAALARLPADEMDAWQALAAGPLDMERLNTGDRPLARRLARLERKGLAIYSGFTPTCAAHVLGRASHWSAEGARLGARIWARQMRQLYGFGPWAQGRAQSDAEADAASRHVMAHLVHSVCGKLVEAGLNDLGQLGDAAAQRLAVALADLALQRPAPDAPQPVFALQFAPQLPLVAVGAPAGTCYPEVAARLGLPLAVPAHAAVANAVGAVMGEVSQRVQLTVTQLARGRFRLFTADGTRDTSSLDEALDLARGLCATQALALAEAAGAEAPSVRHEQRDNRVDDALDGSVFFEAVVTAIASGPPRL